MTKPTTPKPKHLLINYTIEGDDRQFRVVVPRTATGELAGQPYTETLSENGDGDTVWGGIFGGRFGTDYILARALLLATGDLRNLDLGVLPKPY